MLCGSFVVWHRIAYSIANIPHVRALWASGDDTPSRHNRHFPVVMHGLFPKRVLDTVLDAMTDHEKLSLEVLDSETKSRAFALMILKMLKSPAKTDLGNLQN